MSVREIEWPPGSGRKAPYQPHEIQFAQDLRTKVAQGDITAEQAKRELDTFHDLKVELDATLLTDEQPTLGLDQNALGGFRSTDPHTSKDAALLAYPRTGSQRERIFREAVKAGEQGICAFEMTRIGLAHQTASTRISELHKKTLLLQDSGRTRTSPLGGEQIVFVVTDLGWREARARGLV